MSDELRKAAQALIERWYIWEHEERTAPPLSVLREPIEPLFAALRAALAKNANAAPQEYLVDRAWNRFNKATGVFKVEHIPPYRIVQRSRPALSKETIMRLWRETPTGPGGVLKFARALIKAHEAAQNQGEINNDTR